MVQKARQAVARIEAGNSIGTGVIFGNDGYTAFVITNHHVIEDASTVTVIVNDATRYTGTVRGTDPTSDLAVIAICCSDRFHQLEFGNASELRPGDEIITIGYARGISGEATVTRGIISAIRYSTDHQSDVIQTDAALNPGNSGGPMLNLEGKIVGINTFKWRDSEGLNFAVSETTARYKAYQLSAASARPTPSPTRRPTPTPSYRNTHSFGPINGELKHEPNDEFIEAESANVSMSDMVVSADFVNPYSAASNGWDYGFIIRDEGGSGRDTHIVVTSNRHWIVNWRSNGRNPDTSQKIASGRINEFDIRAGGSNNLWLLAAGNRGLLFINGEFISILDLSAHTGTGDISISTGNFTGNEVAGAVTKFEDFQGGSLSKEYGPVSGILKNEPGRVSTHGSNLWTQSFIAEAEFVNPGGSDWDYGFAFRSPKSNQLEIIVLTGYNQWYHYTKDAGDNEYTDVDNGRLLSGTLKNTNHLLLMVIEENGYFFINGELITMLDLSHNPDYGNVIAIAGFYNSHTAEPQFRNFNVWTMD